MSNNNSSKLTGSYPMRFVSLENKMKIGKINDTISFDKCTITKEPGVKSFKLSERKSNKQEIKYTGIPTGEQTSKYLIIKYNKESKQFDLIPVDEDWYFFKKEIHYNTIPLDDAEEKMKAKNVLIDYIRNKGTTTVTKGKKAKQTENKDSEPASSKVRKTVNKFEEEDDEDDRKAFDKEDKKELSEYENDEPDIDLKEIPSDIEEAFTSGNDKTKSKLLFQEMEDLPEEESESDDIFGKENENEDSDIQDDDSGLSEVGANKANKNLLGNKRKGGELKHHDKKKQNNFDIDALSEALDNFILKYCNY